MKNEIFKLSNGCLIPAIGFGTWQIPDGDVCYEAVSTALKAGYRHIDTALAYNNEKSVGKALKNPDYKREEIFVTTKLPAEIKGYEETKTAFKKSLENLGLDYIDLYLIHAPKPWGVNTNGMEYMNQNIESWRAMEELYQEGKIKAIGVSNFQPMHLNVFLKSVTIMPMVNQILVNPTHIPTDNIRYCQEKNILVEAYSPLATGRIFSNNDKFEAIAKKYGKTIAQLLIRWSYQNGLLPLPKSVTPSRIAENQNIFDFTISDLDMALIGKIN